MDRHRKYAAYALLVFGAGGAVGVLLDLDHLAVLLARGVPVSWQALATQAARPAHLPAVLVSGAVCGTLGARFVGLLAVAVMNDIPRASYVLAYGCLILVILAVCVIAALPWIIQP